MAAALGGGRAALLLILALGRRLRAAGRQSLTFAFQQPVLLLIVFRLAEALGRRYSQRRRLLRDQQRVKCATEDIDTELIQGCLLSLEHLRDLGRVEKRTLFTRQLRDVLGFNRHLERALLEGAQQCRRHNHNCLVMRWLPPDERYHILQACLNSVSALFGANYVHCNAFDGENSELFRSFWYCLTLMTPTRPKGLAAFGGGPQGAEHLLSKSPRSSGSMSRQQSDAGNTCTFTDMSRTPRGTLRVVLVNESELRKVADGSISPPTWGFFNARHSERYRMMKDFARNFQKQLVRTPASAKAMTARNPFTSERAHTGENLTLPDGGMMKRVQSQPDLAGSVATVHFRDRGGAASPPGPLARMAAEGGGRHGGAGKQPPLTMREMSTVSGGEEGQAADGGDGAVEENCFLRLHVPFFWGERRGGRDHDLQSLARALRAETVSPRQLTPVGSFANFAAGAAGGGGGGTNSTPLQFGPSGGSKPTIHRVGSSGVMDLSGLRAPA